MTSPEEQCRVIIFGQGRTGSTLLEELLSNTGSFASYGELIGASGKTVADPVRYIEGHARLRAKQNFICHVKIYHLTEDRTRSRVTPVNPAMFLGEMARRNYRFIYLRRENFIRHAISNIVAETKGRWHKSDDRRETIKVTVRKEKLVQEVMARTRFAPQERAALTGLPHFEVVYERDLESPERHQQTVDGAMDFLGLPRAPALTQLRRINTRPLHDIVANYDDLEQWADELGRRHDLEPHSSANVHRLPAAGVSPPETQDPALR